MARLDIGLYHAMALLTATGLTGIKHALTRLGGAGLLALGWTDALALAAATGIYLGGMLMWLVVLGRNEMSTAYPIGIGLSLAATTLAAILVLGEPVGALRLLGIAAILAGALCIGKTH
jgi:quaternary ammonium compound-resistance protein SugE